jgi:exopolysaccharide biosynthesis protein
MIFPLHLTTKGKEQILFGNSTQATIGYNQKKPKLFTSDAQIKKKSHLCDKKQENVSHKKNEIPSIRSL